MLLMQQACEVVLGKQPAVHRSTVSTQREEHLTCGAEQQASPSGCTRLKAD